MKENEIPQKEESGGGRFDIGNEFRESFDHAALTGRYIEQAIKLTIETNPLIRVIEPVSSAPDEIKKDVFGRCQKSMQIWLDSYDALLTEGKNLSVDLIGYAADLARKKRKSIQ